MNYTYKLKYTRLQVEIWRLLCQQAGKKLNQRQIAKLLDVSANAVGKSLKELGKDKLASVEKAGEMNLNLVELNRDNRKAMLLKRAENLRTIYESGLAEYLEDKYPGCTVILFGSYARGDDTFSSDIDIGVIGSEKRADVTEYSKALGKPVNINNYKDWKLRPDLKASLLEGIVLSGGIAV